MSMCSFRGVARGLLLSGLALLIPTVGLAQTSFPGSTGANAPCAAATLGDYENLGFAGCTVGAATFYNFSASGYQYDANFNYTTVDVASGITLAPGANGVPTIVFSASPGSSLFNLNSGYGSYTIEYYVDPPIDLVGFRLSDAPFNNAEVDADVCVDNTFASFNGCFGQEGEGIASYAFAQPAAVGTTEEYFAYIDPNQQSDFAPFDHTTQFLDVVLTIDLYGGDSPSDLPSFGAGVDPLVTTVPEPSGIALTALGGLALIALRARRRTTTNG